MRFSFGQRIFNNFNRVICRVNDFTVLDRSIEVDKQERKRRMHTEHETLTSQPQTKQIGRLFRCVRALLERMTASTARRIKMRHTTSTKKSGDQQSSVESVSQNKQFITSNNTS